MCLDRQRGLPWTMHHARAPPGQHPTPGNTITAALHQRGGPDAPEPGVQACSGLESPGNAPSLHILAAPGALLGRDKCFALGAGGSWWVQEQSRSPSPACRGRSRIKAKEPSHLTGLEQQMKGGHWEPRITKGEWGKFGPGRDFWLVGFPLRNPLCLFHHDEDPFYFFIFLSSPFLLSLFFSSFTRLIAGSCGACDASSI